MQQALTGAHKGCELLFFLFKAALNTIKTTSALRNRWQIRVENYLLCVGCFNPDRLGSLGQLSANEFHVI